MLLLFVKLLVQDRAEFPLAGSGEHRHVRRSRASPTRLHLVLHRPPAAAVAVIKQFHLRCELLFLVAQTDRKVAPRVLLLSLLKNVFLIKESISLLAVPVEDLIDTFKGRRTRHSSRSVHCWDLHVSAIQFQFDRVRRSCALLNRAGLGLALCDSRIDGLLDVRDLRLQWPDLKRAILADVDIVFVRQRRFSSLFVV